jgi:hypothetical protein
MNLNVSAPDPAEPATGAIAAASRRPKPEHLSQLLQRLRDEASGPLTVRQLAEALEERSFGAFLVVFAMPNLIPLPPGATLILGLPLVFIGWQMALGRGKLWLPKRIADFTIERTQFEAMIGRVLPWLRWLETIVKPRVWPLDNPLFDRLVSFFVLVLGIVVLAPIPFGNWLPAFAIGIIGLARTERDGISLAVGLAIGLVSCVIVVLVVMAAVALIGSVV